MEVIALLAMGMVNILCFIAGAKVGMAVKKGEDIKVELPTANPIETIKTHLSKKEQAKEQARIDVIMQNIEMYDGTSSGQRDIPRR